MADKHSPEHEFLRMDTEDKTNRTRIPPRAHAKRLEAMGMFPGAHVVRGHDWRWGNQDGGLGMVGKVLSVSGWQTTTARSIITVEWTALCKKNIYRRGHGGKVDLKCTVSGNSSGGYYYPEHLLVLGTPYESSRDGELVAGDQVKVELEFELVKLMQEGHGGWNDFMVPFLSHVGVVNTVMCKDPGDILVWYRSDVVLRFNPDVLTKVDLPLFETGDVVCVLDDLAELHRLQTNIGEWNDDMALSPGQFGRVIRILDDGRIIVVVGGRRWNYNPACLLPAADEHASKVTSSVDGPNLEMLSSVEQLTPEIFMHVIMLGSTTAVRNFLDKNPSEVNMKLLGKSPLHVAIADGQVNVLKTLLQYTSNVDVGDTDGDTPLHTCAHHNDEQAAWILINAGADVNRKNALGFTPLEVAAIVGHCRILRLFVKHPNIHLDSQDFEGDTALHRAVKKHQSRSVAILLDAGADPTVFNEDYFTPILEAARNAFFPAMELFMERFPRHVNMLKSDDGHSALHIAAANDHCDILCFLASMDSSDLDARNVVGHTPLYVAAVEGHSRIVEHIVGYGASVSAVTLDGNTPLHVIVGLKNMRPLCQSTPEMLKVHDRLSRLKKNQSSIPPYVVVACFLLREGADLNARNMNGLTPLHTCAPDVASLLKSYYQEKNQSSFRGSLPRFTPVQGQPPQHELRTEARKTEPTTADYSGSSKLVERSTHDTTQPPADVPTPSHPTISKVNLTSKALTKDKGVQSDLTEKQQDKDHSSRKGDVCDPNDEKDMQENKLCFLCEDVIPNIRFEPCGHTTMCSQCAGRVKKCPLCRAFVQVKSSV